MGQVEAPEYNGNGEIKSTLHVLSRDVGFIKDNLVVAVTELSHSVQSLTITLDVLRLSMESLTERQASNAKICEKVRSDMKLYVPLRLVLILLGVVVGSFFGVEYLKHSLPRWFGTL